MTVLQIILALCVFALAFWVVNRYVAAGLFKNILIGIIVVLALLALLSGFGLMSLLNTRIGGG